MVEFILFGEPYPNVNPEFLTQDIAKKTLSACLESKDFEVIELRHLVKNVTQVFDIIIVDCINDQIPSRNSIGIQVRERLALVFTSDRIPEVRALRKDFPNVPHLNHVPPNEPASFCLYFEPWNALERTWTVQKHLKRIIWWLSDTAKGTLHRNDQRVEQLYFDSPYEIVLPPDFDDKIKDQSFSLNFIPIFQSNGKFRVIRGVFYSKGQAEDNKISHEVLLLKLAPVVHGDIERFPDTLGQIHDQLESRKAPFLDKLNKLITEKVEVQGVTPNTSEKCLLILNIPVKRTLDAEPEFLEIRAFQLFTDLATLGEKTGVLTNFDGKIYHIPIINESTLNKEIVAWRQIKVTPINVNFAINRDKARKYSGTTNVTADFKGVLAGVGALGSALAELWAKEWWGEWTFIDTDFIKAHNIIRHIAKDFHVGRFKVDVVKEMTDRNYIKGYYLSNAIQDSAINWTNSKVTDAISVATLLVDATTTLEVPRDLAQRDIPRSVSVFLTPSGHSSTLLFESADRTIRLDSLEAQYYHAIINSDWGSNHLDGHGGGLWIGAGCRDKSAIISNEMIQLHAATIARQLRLLKDQPEPAIRIWSTDLKTGAIVAHDVFVHKSLSAQYGEWKVYWNMGIQQILSKIRNNHLPNETGGIILGYIDQKLKSIYIVDVLRAPLDSEASQTGFTRGVEGLEVALKEVKRRTANIVDYIGEWHSHPAFTSSYPSNADQVLIEKLADTLRLEGQPALMVIIGTAGDMSLSVKEG